MRHFFSRARNASPRCVRGHRISSCRDWRCGMTTLLRAEPFPTLQTCVALAGGDRGVDFRGVESLASRRAGRGPEFRQGHTLCGLRVAGDARGAVGPGLEKRRGDGSCRVALRGVGRVAPKFHPRAFGGVGRLAGRHDRWRTRGRALCRVAAVSTMLGGVRPLFATAG